MMIKLKERVFTTVNRLWVVVAAMAVAMTAYSTDCVWLADQGGDWSVAANWKDGIVPSQYSDTADFSVLTGDKIVRRDYYSSSQVAGAVIYSPIVGDATNTLTITANSLDVAYSITVGEKAVLKTQCIILLDYKKTGVTDFYKYGAGTLRVENGLYKYNSAMYFNHIEGAVIMAKEGDAGVIGLHYRSGSNDPSLAPAAFIIESCSTVSVNSSAIGNWRIGTNDGARASFTINGGVLDATTFKNGGCLFNADGSGSICSLNVVNGGFLNGGTTRSFYVSYNGTGTLNQTDGIIACKELTMSGSSSTGIGTYNFNSGELWLNSMVSCTHSGNVINIGNAKIVGTGTTVYLPYDSGNSVGYDAPITIGERLEVAVTNETSTFNLWGTVAGLGALVKTGPGVLNLGKRQKPFTGPIVVSNGTVEVDVKILGTNDITVASGARLKIACPYSTPYIDPESTIDMAADASIELSGDRAVTVKQLSIGGKLMRGDGRKYGSSDHVLDVDVVDDVHFSGGGILVVTGHVYRGISIGFR